MRKPLRRAGAGETLQQVVSRLGPEGVGAFFRDGAGFDLRIAGVETSLERTSEEPARFRLGGTGLIATVEIEVAEELGVAVQAVTITNDSGEPSAPLWEIDAFCLPLNITVGDRPFACGYGGGLTDGFYPPKAYRPEAVTFGEARQWRPASRGFHRWWVGKGVYRLASIEAGRSSVPNIPLMQAGWRTSDGEIGLWAALEWSGRWSIEFGNEMAWQFAFRAGPRVNKLVLEPGETLRLPRVHVGICDPTEDGFANSIRRYVAEVLSPDVAGRRPGPVAAYDHWFGLHENINEAVLIEQIDRAAELGLEYFVVDAGWYPAPQDKFWTGVGNWHGVDTAKFPRGLEPVAEHTKAKGLGFGLWFEPERAYRGSDWLDRHPEWFWDTGGASPHLNLTLREAQDGLIEMLSGWIERLDIRWLRWDNNQAPGPFWDAIDPTGKVQFGYVEGLYRVFDELLARHPNLMIDNCAGGGTRIDFGTLRRSGTMVISDHAEDHHVCRIMQTGGARVFPGNYMNSSLYVGEKDADRSAVPLALVSRMGGSVTLNGHIANWTRKQTALVKRYIDGFKVYRHLLMKDFHPLTRYPRDETDWDVVQFVDQGTGEAVVLAYRVRGQEKSRRVFPRSLSPDATYRIVDPFSSRKPRTASGAEIMAKGLRLSLAPESGAVRHLAVKGI
jgi:alpha-galactosidase